MDLPARSLFCTFSSAGSLLLLRRLSALRLRLRLLSLLGLRLFSFLLRLRLWLRLRLLLREREPDLGRHGDRDAVWDFKRQAPSEETDYSHLWSSAPQGKAQLALAQHCLPNPHDCSPRTKKTGVRGGWEHSEHQSGTRCGWALHEPQDTHLDRDLLLE